MSHALSRERLSDRRRLCSSESHFQIFVPTLARDANNITAFYGLSGLQPGRIYIPARLHRPRFVSAARENMRTETSVFCRSVSPSRSPEKVSTLAFGFIVDSGKREHAAKMRAERA